MNRQQRRALKRAGKRKKLPANVDTAVRNVESAVKKLDKVAEFDSTLEEMRDLLVGTQESLGAMATDYRKLTDELETQREMNIRLLAILLGSAVQRNFSEWTEQDLDRVRALEGSLREQYTGQQDGQ
jgi:ABC-type transporter Mla subunit MlaD